MKIYIYLFIALLTLMAFSGADAALLSNQYIEVSIDDATGQFTMGKPDDGPVLLYGHPNPWSSYTSVRMDNVDYTNNGAPFGVLTGAPSNSDDTNTTVFTLGDLQITQDLTLVESWSSGNADWVMIEYAIENNGSSSHSVGVRLMLDTMLGNNDGAPFRIPGTGAVTYEKEYDSDSMPMYYLAFDNLANPTVVSQGTLQGELAVKPDRFLTAYWPRIYGTDWDFTVDPDEPLDGDSAVGIYWYPENISPGETINFVTYYGIGNITVDSSPPIVVGLTSPSELSVIDKELSPSPFTIVAFLENSATGVNETLTGITAELTLPFGLELDSGETAEKTVNDLVVGENTQVSWQVVGTGIIGDSLSYSVTVSVGNSSISPSSKVVSKYVTLPGSVPGFIGTGGDNQVSFTWTNLDLSTLTWDDIDETNWQGTLILRREGTWAETLPADGTSYNAGDTIGSAAVIYSGSGNYSSTPLVDTGRTNGTRYYYTAFTYDSEGDYIPAGAIDFVTPLTPDTSAPEDITDFSAVAGSGRVTLSWENPSINDYPDFEGVKILRRTGGYPTGADDSQATYIYNGTGTGWTDTFDITNETTYYYTAYTYDEAPNYSNGSGVSATPSSGLAETGGGGGGGGGCFIATAAYGTPSAKEVRALTEFRDRRLMNCEPGRQLVKFYYGHGPGFAKYIETQPVLKAIVRGILKPCIYFLE